jgi:hypothetical protein
LSTFGALLRHCVAIGWALLWTWRNHDFKTFRLLVSEHWRVRNMARRALPDFTTLDERGITSRKKANRVYLFGSGYSLNEISEQEWATFRKYDTVGFSGSIYLQKIELTFLLLRAWNETSAGSLAWKKDADEVLGAIAANPHLENTCFVFQKGATAIFSNRLIGHRLWKRNHAFYLYLADKVSRRPHRDIRKGLVHGKSTLCSAVSFAVAMGYDEIVLVGVDLYDSRYFWLPPDKTLGWSAEDQKLIASDRTVRGATISSVHNTVNNGIIDFLGDWRRHLKDKHGIELFVYNPRSLLARTVPVFEASREI